MNKHSNRSKRSVLMTCPLSSTHRQHINLVPFTIDSRSLCESGLWHVSFTGLHVFRIYDRDVLCVHIVRNEISRVLFVPLPAKNIQFPVALKKTIKNRFDGRTKRD